MNQIALNSNPFSSLSLLKFRPLPKTLIHRYRRELNDDPLRMPRKNFSQLDSTRSFEPKQAGK